MDRDNGVGSSVDATAHEGGGRQEAAGSSGKGASPRRKSSSIWSKKEQAQLKRINTILESLGSLSLPDDEEAMSQLADPSSPLKRARDSDIKKSVTQQIRAKTKAGGTADKFNTSSDDPTAQRIEEKSDEGSSQGSKEGHSTRLQKEGHSKKRK